MIIFCDVETTGLDPRKGCLLEVALLAVTDQLEPLDQGISTLVRPVGTEALVGAQQEAMVDGLPIPLDVERLHPKVRDMHLTNRLFFFDLAHAQAEGRLPRLHEAQAALCDYIDGHCIKIFPPLIPQVDDRGIPQPGAPYPRDKWPLAGNSIHFDRAWLKEHMPLLEDRFSHRNVDASTLYELCKRWRPGAAQAKGGEAHRAMPDVLESLERLRHYRRELFTADERAFRALDLVRRYGGIDGAHHKTWVIDQVTRALTGDGYADFVKDCKAGKDGPDTWEWDEGIAP